MQRDYGIDYKFKEIDRNITDLKAYVEKLEGMVTERNGTILPLKPYPSYPYNLEQKELDQWYEKCKVIREENKPVIENNLKIYNEAKRYLLSIGMPESKSVNVAKRGRNPKWERQNLGWVTDLYSNIPTSDYFTSNVEEIYKRRCEEITRKAAEQKALEEKRERELHRQKSQESKLRKMVALQIKYDVDDNDELLDKILGSCKYLHLGHYLSKNRIDYNDGTDFAELGLDKFASEEFVGEDALIYDEIQDLINNWDGDGRCFRDCEYNYDYLFGKVDADLYKDYITFKECTA